MSSDSYALSFEQRLYARAGTCVDDVLLKGSTLSIKSDGNSSPVSLVPSRKRATIPTSGTSTTNPLTTTLKISPNPSPS